MNLEQLRNTGVVTGEVAERLARTLEVEPTSDLSDKAALSIISHSVQAMRRENERLRQKLEEDSLTKLATRECFENQLTKMHRRYLQDPRDGYTLFVWDMDNFKIVNDTHGHAVGDECLRRAGGAIKEKMRPLDLAARLGGDEFAAIVTGSLEDEDAQMLISRVGTGLTSALDAMAEEGLLGRAVQEQIGISAGFASPEQTDSAASVLNRADQNMYVVKAAGKQPTYQNRGHPLYS